MITTATVINFDKAAQALGKAPTASPHEAPDKNIGISGDGAGGELAKVPPNIGGIVLDASVKQEMAPLPQQPDMKSSHKKGKLLAAGYSSWSAMKQRCTNENHKHYKDYGARGIKFTPSWVTFAKFSADMGPPPNKGASLERRDVNDDYCKENCEWASPKTQARNRRNNRMVEFRGKDYTLAELAEWSGIEASTLRARLEKGMTAERAVRQPVQWGGERQPGTSIFADEYDRWPPQLTAASADKLEVHYANRDNRKLSRPAFFLWIAHHDFQEAYDVISNPDSFSPIELEKAEKCMDAQAQAIQLLQRLNSLKIDV